ncbi:hypothetical protein BDV12DRAFT_210686 [Aspergillus spectabilis]
MKQLNFLIVGAGSRGTAYARAITTSTPARISAIAEPEPYKRRAFGEAYIWGSESPRTGQEFEGWEEWIEYETRRREVADSAGNNEGIGTEGGVDGLLICTLDETHIKILTSLSKSNLLDLHVLCEKPLALSLSDCLSIYAARAKSPAARNSIFSIGHVLRYSPHNLLLRRLVREEKVIGDIVSIEHTEPVGYWHFAHSYVRGNWRRETQKGDGSLLTKSCHDIDFLVWLVEGDVVRPSSGNVAATGDTTANGSGNSNGTYIEEEERTLKLRTIHSTGYLTQFRPDQKPKAAGSATNCTSCAIERDCIYSAIRIYRDNQLRKGETGWPVNIVCPDIEDYLPDKFRLSSSKNKDNDEVEVAAAETHLLKSLTQNYTPTTPDEEIRQRPWYGRCVYESDNDVVDDQLVSLSWDVIPPPSSSSSSHPSTTTTQPPHFRNKSKPPGITASFHMTSPTKSQCIRRGTIYGTLGEITYTSSSITIHSFTTSQTTIIDIPAPPPNEAESHGGGDYGLACGFVGAVEAVKHKGWDVERAQREFVGCSVEEVVRSHAVVFAAEESRRGERVVRWEGWWGDKLREVGLGE